MKRYCYRYLVVMSVFLLLGVSGCGSGGGGTNTPGTPAYSDIPVSNEQRNTALVSASAAFDNFLEDNPGNVGNEMADYLKSLPEFEDAGTSEDGSTWGRFTDGRLAIFVNNRTPLAVPLPRGKSITPPSDLPGGSNSHVGDNLGERYGDPYSTITPWLQDAGYGASLPGEFTDMTSMGSLGLLVISSHGGTGVWRDGSKAYAIWGSAFDTASGKDDIYENELNERRLCYMYADSGYEPNKNLNQWRYAFTAKYVMEYMNFEKGSLVFMDACSSDDPVMKAAFLAKGASVYVGWSSPVDSAKAGIASKYLFDRLLGANHYKPESPKQRPFDWKSVFSWMQENGYDIGQDAGGCYLMMTEADGSGNGFGVLAPSLQFMFVHPYDEELYLYGLFGDDSGNDGTVTVGGTALLVKAWERDNMTNLDRIVCEIPFDGSGSSGDVQVTVRGHKSNIRQLSLYEGDITLNHDTGDGRYYEILHHLRFRADLQSFRTKPHETPGYEPANPQYVDADDPSDGRFEAGGATVIGDTSISWAGEGAMSNNINGDGNTEGFIATIRFDPAAKSARLMLSGSVQNGVTKVISNPDGSVSYPEYFIYGLDTFDGTEDYRPSYVEFNLNEDFSFPEVNREAQTVQMLYGIMPYGGDTVTVSFDPISCQSPPDPEAAR